MRPGAFLYLACLILACSPVVAEEGWALKDARLRYDLDLRAPPIPLPADMKIPTSRVVGAETFPDGRVPDFPMTTPGDLVWRYLLALPTGELSDKREVLVADRFPIKGGHLIVEGKQFLRRKGKTKLTIKTELVLKTDIAGHPLAERGAQLMIRATFDLKRGLLKEAQLKLVAKVMVAGQPGELRWSGVAKPGDVFDVGKTGFHTQVEKAIAKGRVWLLKATRQRLASFKGAPKAGQRQGRMSLACFALLRSGVSPKALQGEFTWLAQQPLEETYSVALWIMALEARIVSREAIRPREQTRSVARYQRGVLPPVSKKLMQAAVDWLVENRKAGWWNYKGIKADPGRGGDRSNSQFAILALHSALACGVKVPKTLWEEVLVELLAGQERSGPKASLEGSVFSATSSFARPEDEAEVSGPADEDATRVRPGGGSESGGPTESRKDSARGWAYGTGGKGAPGSAYGSMTAAGVSSLAITRAALGSRTGATHSGPRGSLQALRDGLAWLARSFDVENNPGRGDKHYYYWLYSLEKAMDTSGVERLAQHEWWRAAAVALLSRQSPQGNWGTPEDTALALLVLGRATLPARLDIEAEGREATGQDRSGSWDKVTVKGVGKLGLRQLLVAMADSPQIAAKRLKLAQQALPQVDAEQRPRLISRLIGLLESPHKATRRWAARACREMSGTEDPQRLRVFARDHEALRRAGEGRPADALKKLRGALDDEEAPTALRHQALLVAARLRAVEILPQVIDALEAKQLAEREHAWDCLVSLSGGEQRDFEPKASARVRSEQVAAWHGWQRDEGQALVRGETLKRALVDLGSQGLYADAAAALLRKRGEEALPLLVDALLSDATKERAHGLLRGMTGATLPADPQAWRDWLKGDRDVTARAAPAPRPTPPPATSTTVPAAPDDPPAVAAGVGVPGREAWGLVPRPSQR